MRFLASLFEARLGFFLLATVWFSSLEAAVPDDPFPRPPELAVQVGFWTEIYGKYSRDEIVFHHPEYLNVVYRVLDLREAAKAFGEDEQAYRNFRRDQVSQVREEIQAQLRELAATRPDSAIPAHLSNLAGLMKRVPGGPEKYTKAADWVRAQRGVREKFATAIAVSGQYMPYIERAFAEAGLPKMLTRLPYVESSFDRRAYSRSGAAGVWQFMPGSARQYMRYDEVADQRRDPWFSTHAAIGHLTDDYELLKDWPLAVTAYNYGRNGLARGREATGIQTLVGLIKSWDGPRWGFAAKNYYASFLAAIEVEQNAERYFGPIIRQSLEAFDEVTTPAYIDYDQIVRLSGLGSERFAWLNPSFSEAVRDGKLYVPRGQIIRTARGRGQSLIAAMAQLPASAKHNKQKAYFARYRVRRGDSLSRIAERYRTSVRSIMRSNNLRSASFIRIGQVLKVPTGEAIPSASSGETQQLAYHRVAPGESLWQIARRYGTSVSVLMADNNIGSPNRLQIGQRLKVRSEASRQIAYRVQVGDTLSQIAQRYGTSVAQIKRDNRINNANMLRLGQVLKITAAEDGNSSRAPLRHRVRSGQTLDGIARRYGISSSRLMRFNAISNPDHIRAGAWLNIPRS